MDPSRDLVFADRFLKVTMRKFSKWVRVEFRVDGAMALRSMPQAEQSNWGLFSVARDGLPTKFDQPTFGLVCTSSRVIQRELSTAVNSDSSMASGFFTPPLSLQSRDLAAWLRSSRRHCPVERFARRREGRIRDSRQTRSSWRFGKWRSILPAGSGRRLSVRLEPFECRASLKIAKSPRREFGREAAIRIRGGRGLRGFLYPA